MSCGMTDKRSQPDEDDMTTKEDFDALRGSQPSVKRQHQGYSAEWCAKMAEAEGDAEIGAGAADLREFMGRKREGSAAAFHEKLAREQDFTVRHAVLDLAVKLYAPRNGFSSDDLLNTANIFLAWLEGKTSAPEADEPEQAPAAPERTPAEMAKIGDLIEVVLRGAGAPILCTVADVLPEEPRLWVLREGQNDHNHDPWPVWPMEVKRIVQKREK